MEFGQQLVAQMENQGIPWQICIKNDTIRLDEK